VGQFNKFGLPRFQGEDGKVKPRRGREENEFALFARPGFFYFIEGAGSVRGRMFFTNLLRFERLGRYNSHVLFMEARYERRSSSNRHPVLLIEGLFF